jgi:hypothetical protein
MSNVIIDSAQQTTGKSIGDAVDLISGILKEYSNQNATKILKMVGALHNVRFVPAFAPLVPQQQTQLFTRDTRGQPGPRGQPKADPTVKALRSQIKELNHLISKKSNDLGGVLLNENDDLIVKRNQLFRELKVAQNKMPQTFKEALEAKAQRTSLGKPTMSAAQ